MTTDTTPAESSGLQRLKRWAALLRAENNSLGHSLETYAMEWEADLAAISTAPVQGLTDEEILSIAAGPWWSEDGIEPLPFARAVLERAALAAAPHTATPVVQPVVPRINADEHGCAMFEWWGAGEKKLTLYTVGHPHESLLKSWGPDPNEHMAYVTLMDAYAVREAFQWLSAAPASDADSMQGSQPTKDAA